jgi:hypothetical protein
LGVEHGAGWPRTRSSPGSTSRGSFPATPTSPPRLEWCWTCTSGSSRQRSSVPMSTSSAPMRRPPSRPAAAATHSAARQGPPHAGRARVRARRLAYLAAWDVHHARLFGRCEPTTGIEPFDRLVAQVMTTQPYASAERVFWVVDNGSSHRGQAAIRRLEGKDPNLRLIPCQSTPPGSTRSRSTSPSSSAGS